jgi:hypothetical protein
LCPNNLLVKRKNLEKLLFYFFNGAIGLSFQKPGAMKKMMLIIVVFFLLFSYLHLPAVAQSNNLSIRYLRMDSVTALGKSIGEPVSQEIGKEGGTISSDDGMIELIFPENALSKKKKIKIQSISNLAANGRGNAYQMEPSGIQFQKPVTLVFHYSENELTGTSAEFKGIAWQDENGKWQQIPEVSVDTVAKTITTQISHFSSYASFDKIVLRPQQARVKVEKSIQMEIHFVISDLDAGIALPPNIPNPQWTVNSIPFGNSDVGRITPLTTNNARFTAPVSMPDQNPVAVAAELKGLEFKFNKKSFKDPSLVSQILIYDKAYRITMDVWVDNSEDGMCTMRLTDHGEFTLVMEGTRTMMKEIANQNLQIRFNACPCVFTWVNKPTQGPINTIGAKRIDVTPASLPATPFRKVKIWLNHAMSPMPVLKTSCPGPQPTPPIIGVILPPLIEFEANNEAEQKITMSELSNGSMKNNRRSGINILIKLVEENDQ